MKGNILSYPLSKLLSRLHLGEVEVREFERTEARRVIFQWKAVLFPLSPVMDQELCVIGDVGAHQGTGGPGGERQGADKLKLFIALASYLGQKHRGIHSVPVPTV